MNITQSLPRWASQGIQKLASREPLPNSQTQPLDQDSFEQVTQTALGILSAVASDEIEGEDLAMGQPGVVSPQAGTVIRYEGDVSSANGHVEAVLDSTDQGAAVYVRTGPNNLDTIAVIQKDGHVIGQGAYIEQGQQGFGGEVVSALLS